MSDIFNPVIKWSGSKRSQAKAIVSFFPSMDKYIEPFVGGGSVMRELLNQGYNGKILCSDINNDLISLWKMIQANPKGLAYGYRVLWEAQGDTLSAQTDNYYYIRKRLNTEHNPIDFMFVLRTCMNGLVRYNLNGEFNTSYHLGRKGIDPSRLEDIIFEWSGVIQGVEFSCKPYWDWEEKGFYYLDPPYGNTKGMYYSSFDKERFFEWLQGKCFALSYDGKRGDKDMTVDIPVEYRRHLYLDSGVSSFGRIVKQTKENVKESLYLSY